MHTDVTKIIEDQVICFWTKSTKNITFFQTPPESGLEHGTVFIKQIGLQSSPHSFLTCNWLLQTIACMDIFVHLCWFVFICVHWTVVRATILFNKNCTSAKVYVSWGAVLVKKYGCTYICSMNTDISTLLFSDQTLHAHFVQWLKE